jgi:hypothetical protein
VSNEAAAVELIPLLVKQGIEFVVVGGMAAVLHGAPISTHDIDIVHRRTPENGQRLLEVLQSLHARYRGQPTGRILEPNLSALLGRGHLNLMTDLGPLDVLCEIEGDLGYEELLPCAVRFGSEETSFWTLGLPKIVEIKKSSLRAKDRLMLPLLISLLERDEN